MKTLYMTKGLPGSGKTTAAKSLVSPGTKRVNRDDLRAMLDNGKWSSHNEAFITNLQNYIVRDALVKGHHVIVDNTNFSPRHEETFRETAKTHGADFKLLDFSHVTPEECIKRDLARPNSVGSKVILSMWEKYIKPEPVPPPDYDPALPECIIVDIDGTIADMGAAHVLPRTTGRKPFEWLRVGEDTPRKIVIETIEHLANRSMRGRKILFVSGRDEVCRPQTRDWLLKHTPALTWNAALFMRPTDDHRRDSLVKREIYENEILGKYNVVAIFDDRPQVIRECWQALGFKDRIFNMGEGKEF